MQEEPPKQMQKANMVREVETEICAIKDREKVTGGLNGKLWKREARRV